MKLALEPPAADSVEQAVTDGMPGTDPALLDLRPARGGAGPSSIRHVGGHARVDVLAALDGLVCLPEMNPSSFVLPG